MPSRRRPGQALGRGLTYSAWMNLTIRIVLVLSMTLLFLAAADAQTADRETALLNPRAIALNPVTGDVYAVAPRENALMVFHKGANSARRIGVGRGPVAVAVNPKTNRIYVANNESGSVSVIDGTAEAVTAKLDVGANPYVLAVDSISNKILVSNTFSDVLTVIDGETNALTKLKASSADAIEVDESMGKVYLLGYENENLHVLDEKSGAISKARMGIHQWGMALDSGHHALYVTMSGSAELAIIDQEKVDVRKVTTGETPCSVALNPASGRLYVVNHTSDSVTVIDLTQSSVIGTIAVGHKPQGIAVNPKRNRIYVANRSGSSVSVIDGALNKVVATIPVAGNPVALMLEPDSGRLYATTLDRPLVIVVP
jgi:YVTN family beta-propeller protein